MKRTYHNTTEYETQDFRVDETILDMVSHIATRMVTEDDERRRLLLCDLLHEYIAEAELIKEGDNG